LFCRAVFAAEQVQPITRGILATRSVGRTFAFTRSSGARRGWDIWFEGTVFKCVGLISSMLSRAPILNIIF
jgi:hypothetical protein